MEMEYKVTARETSSSLSQRRFLKEVVDKVNSDTELLENIKKCNRDFFAEIQRIAEAAKPEYFGTAILGAIQRAPRYSYIKNLEHDGKVYDAEIDALSRTVILIQSGIVSEDED